jgi:hypothetical protein
MYNKNSTWKIFGPAIRVGDRLTKQKHKYMQFDEMVEDPNGSFIFLPPNENHKFFESKDSKQVKDRLDKIKSLLEEINEL